MSYDKYFTPQIDEYDCGVAAFSTILKFYGSSYSLATLRKLTNTNTNGTTALALIKAAVNLGFNATGVSADVDHIQSQPPFIAQILNKSGFYHFIVVFNIKNEVVTIADPDSVVGVSKLSIQDFNDVWTGIAILFSPTKKYVAVHENTKKHIRYTGLLKSNLRNVLLLIGISIFILFIEIIGAYFSQLLLNKLIPTQNISFIIDISLILIFSYVIQQSVNYLQGLLTTKFYIHLSKNIVMDFVGHVISLPMLFFNSRTTGDITSRINDSYEIINSFAKLTVSFFVNALTIMGLLVILFFQDSFLAIFSLSVMPIYLAIFYAFFKSFKIKKRQVLESKSLFDTKLIETIRGIETVKSLNVEDNVIVSLQKIFNKFMVYSADFNILEIRQQCIKICVSSVLNIIILTLGAAQIINGSLSTGQLITFTILFNLLSEAIQQVIGLEASIQTAKIASNRLNEIFLLPKENLESVSDKIFNFSDKITVQNLTYYYNSSNNAGIENISLTIHAYSKIAIVGPSGCGKTTLGKLLSSIYQSKDGNILYDSYPADSLSVSTIRKFIQYVPQSSILFKGSVIENLLYGISKDISMEKVKYICDLVCIREDIDKMPQKFNTVISENGTSMSGGQKQRLALARALLSDSKVLVLDESTSSLDKITEEKVISNLLSLKDKTIIFIAHHTAIAEKSDQVLLLRNGKLAGVGTHAELLENNSYYQQLNQG